jgi:hypothetical protein
MLALFYAAVRSHMNVPFTIPSNPELEKEFISQAAKHGMVCIGCQTGMAAAPGPHDLQNRAIGSCRSNSRAIAVWEACAQASTTACQLKGWRSWQNLCAHLQRTMFTNEVVESRLNINLKVQPGCVISARGR